MAKSIEEMKAELARKREPGVADTESSEKGLHTQPVPQEREPEPSELTSRQTEPPTPRRASAARRSPSSQDVHRSPPHSAEAEQGVLGSMLLSPVTVIGECVDRINGEFFYIPAHQTIFNVLVDLWDAGTAIDLITFTQILRDRKLLDAVGGASFVTSLYMFVPTAANVDYYLGIVRDKYVLRQVIAASTESVRRAYEEQDDVNSLLAAEEEKFEIIRAATTGNLRLPGVRDLSKMIGPNRPVQPPELVKGILHQGSKLIVGGTSKGRKTMALLDLAVSVATGSDWWGFPCKMGPVCYINFEIQEAFFCERTHVICCSKKVELAAGMLMGWNLRGHGEGIENLVDDLMSVLRHRTSSLIVVDPIYKALGDRDENKAGDVASMLNELERIAVKTGAAVAFGAHYSKGNQSLKESIDRIGGSGVFARDPDSILTMTAHEEDDAFVVDATLRNFAPIKPFVVKWDWPLFSRDDELDPEELKQARKPRTGQFEAKHSKEMLLEELSIVDGLRPATLRKKMDELHGMSKATFYRLARELHDKNVIIEREGEWFKAGRKSETSP